MGEVVREWVTQRGFDYERFELLPELTNET